jgi:hypothetical protein
MFTQEPAIYTNGHRFATNSSLAQAVINGCAKKAAPWKQSAAIDVEYMTNCELFIPTLLQYQTRLAI